MRQSVPTRGEVTADASPLSERSRRSRIHDRSITGIGVLFEAHR
jgi:hypothetical protein